MQQNQCWSKGHSNDQSRLCSLTENGEGADTPPAARQMFELDFSEQEKGTGMSREDIKFCETVESGIVHLEDLHYEMPLQFKHQNIRLPNNYAQAEKRLNGLKRRLKVDDILRALLQLYV